MKKVLLLWQIFSFKFSIQNVYCSLKLIIKSELKSIITIEVLSPFDRVFSFSYVKINNYLDRNFRTHEHTPSPIAYTIYNVHTYCKHLFQFLQLTLLRYAVHKPVMTIVVHEGYITYLATSDLNLKNHVTKETIHYLKIKSYH